MKGSRKYMKAYIRFRKNMKGFLDGVTEDLTFTLDFGGVLLFPFNKKFTVLYVNNFTIL